ncbi:MAG: HAMP domain-containing histidine kinase [Clostridiales bacterium]|nr:HAMP domain-containing histidine kinase [Clostridiales bacterium]
MRRPPRHSFTALLLTYMAFVLVVSSLLAGGFYLVFFLLGLVPAFLLTHMGGPAIVVVMLIFFALTISMPLGRMRLRPLDEIANAMSRVAEGDFDVRVDETGLEGDVGQLAHSFNDMAEELGSIEMFRTDFINNFSHEFKTPIVSIRGFAKQLERDDLTEEQRREYASIIVTESERLANMSSNVLLLSKLENQQIVADKQLYSLDEQLRRSILLLEKQWSAKELELDLDLDEVDYLGNEEMMSHVWVNLLGNAIKFSPQGGTLHIACHRQPQGIVVTVRDHGEGMTEEVQARIFEKFYQGDTAHAQQGNGLGLSLVKRIVDLCHGRVEVHSRVGEGTEFTVVLPNER